MKIHNSYVIEKARVILSLLMLVQLCSFSQAQAQIDTDQSGSRLIPVVYFRQPVSGIITLCDDAQNVYIRHCGETHVSENADGTVELDNGEILLLARKEIDLVSGSARVRFAGRTLALVAKNENRLKITILSDKGPNSTRITAGKHQFFLSAGEESIIAGDEESVRAAIREDGRGRRRLQIDRPSGDLSIARCETSLVSIMLTNFTIRKVIHSNVDADRAIGEKLLKMAASLMTATAGHGLYKQL